MLHHLNTAESRCEALRTYTRDFARIVDGENYAGADMVGNWYFRNVRIYANILRFMETGDRLVLIYRTAPRPAGAGLVRVRDCLPWITPCPTWKPTWERPRFDAAPGGGNCPRIRSRRRADSIRTSLVPDIHGAAVVLLRFGREVSREVEDIPTANLVRSERVVECSLPSGFGAGVNQQGTATGGPPGAAALLLVGR